MSSPINRTVIDLSEPVSSGSGSMPVPAFSGYDEPKKRGRLGKVLILVSAVVVFVLAVGGIAGYFYWQSLKSTPQYSLALLVDAARRDDQNAVDELVEIDTVVNDFLPQITGKALELYGRGLPPKTVQRVALVAQPLMPAVKDRARAELPRVIREKTERFDYVPFSAMVIGADQYLDISVQGDTANVKSKVPGRPLELKMQRSGQTWQVVGVHDEQLATRIAQRIGQEIIAVATNGGVEGAGRRLGISNIQNILKQAEEVLR